MGHETSQKKEGCRRRIVTAEDLKGRFGPGKNLDNRLMRIRRGRTPFAKGSRGAKCFEEEKKKRWDDFGKTAD